MEFFLSILPIIIALALLIFLTFKRFSVVFLCILCSVVVAVLSGMPVMDAIFNDFMSGAAGYIQSYYIMFFIGVILSLLMIEVDAHIAIARGISRLFHGNWCLVGIALAAFVMDMGGIWPMVIAFILYPISAVLCKENDIPLYMIPAAIAGGSFSAANAIPGAPLFSNDMCSEIFGTKPTAGALIGCVWLVLYIVLFVGYLVFTAKRDRRKGLHFEMAQVKAGTSLELSDGKEVRGIDTIKAITPTIVIFILYSAVGLDINLSLLIGLLTLIVLYFPKLRKKIIPNIGKAAGDAAAAIIVTGSVVGFGSVIKMTEGFQNLIGAVQNMSMHPYVSYVLSIALLCGACGSGSGGFVISMETLAPRYAAMPGLDMGNLHRLSCVATTTLDSLPHNSAVTNIINGCGLTHRNAYWPIFVSTVIITSICTAVATLLAVLMG